MRIAHFLAVVAVCVLYTRASVAAPNAPGTKTATSALDSDHDGLSDALEQALLVRFEPSFQVDPQDCAGVPAAFLPDRSKPVVAAEDGTLYGQAMPRTLSGMAGRLVELRYFHLWKSDCGRMGHALDAEHVSVLIQAQPDTDGAAGWQRPLLVCGGAPRYGVRCEPDHAGRDPCRRECRCSGVDLAGKTCLVSQPGSLPPRVRRRLVRLDASAECAPDRQPWRRTGSDEWFFVDRLSCVAACG